MSDNHDPRPYADVRIDVLGSDLAPMVDGCELHQFMSTPIVTDARLYILGSGSELEIRAAGLFAEAWERIPRNVKDRVVTLWSDLPHIYRTQEWAPEIYLAANCHQSGTLNHAKNLGNEVLWFRDSMIKNEDDEAIRTRFAHEVAHSFIAALGDLERKDFAARLPEAKSQTQQRVSSMDVTRLMAATGLTPDQLRKYETNEEERLVTLFLREWNFNPDLID